MQADMQAVMPVFMAQPTHDKAAGVINIFPGAVPPMAT